MKKKFVIALLGIFVNALALGQQGPPQQLTGASAANQQSLSSSLGLQAFPAKNRRPQQQQVMKSLVIAGQSRIPVSIPTPSEEQIPDRHIFPVSTES